MQHHSPTEPDKTRQPLKNAMSTHEKPDKTRQPSKMWGPAHAKPTLGLQAATALAHFLHCHEMAPNGTNGRSHQTLPTGPVTNNGPLTRKIRFVTALSFILTALPLLGEHVTKSPWAPATSSIVHDGSRFTFHVSRPSIVCQGCVTAS